MKHYTEQEINLLLNNIQESNKLLADSVKWVESNLKHEDKHSLLLKLKNAYNTFYKVSNSIGSKPVIAVFGGSQVGKSYLIKNLLSQKKQPFFIKNNNIDYDFLKSINPPGVGAESTGMVTRFTVSNEVKFEKFPIKIKLLNPKDILILVLDSFFLDLKRIKYFINSKELDAHIKSFENNYSSKKQSILTEFDVLEIKVYFENHLSKHTILFEGLNETRFFERIGKIIDGFEFQEWDNIFKFLWNENEHLSKLFNQLINGLNSLNFDSQVYIEFKEVLRGEGEILDVKRLKELYSCDKFIIIKKDNGDEIKINISLITALAAELVFYIPNNLLETKEFLANSDLLDFPGAKSRLAFEIEDINSASIPEMLLRGKVSYLFNKYSDDFNINNLLFCTNDQKNEVNEIPSLLFNWISKNIGINSHERTNSLIDSNIPPLFIIFTFFNNQLEFDSTNDFEYNSDFHKLDYKWETRFNRLFKDEIVSQTKDWETNWIKDNSYFKNFYLLRDFKYSTDSFEGFEQEGYEIKTKDERVLFLEKLKESFINFDFVKNHFDNPLYNWEKATSLNNDGSELIIENLAKVSNNNTKINHNINKIKTINVELINDLNKYIYSDDISEIRNKNMKNLNDFQASFDVLLTRDIAIFNKLVKSLTLNPIEIFKLLNDNILINTHQITQDNVTAAQILISRYDELNDVNSVNEVFEILKLKLHLSSNVMVEEYLKNSGIQIEQLFTKKEPVSRARILTDLVLNHWITKINNTSNFEFLNDLGFSKKNTTFLAEHFLIIINKRGLKDKLERILNDVISEIFLSDGIEEFLSETFCLIINEIVINFDLNYFTEEELSEIDNLNQIHNYVYFNRNTINDNETIERLFDNSSDKSTEAFDKYNKWIELFRISLLVNSGFVSYDENANNQLIELIERYNQFKLN